MRMRSGGGFGSGFGDGLRIGPGLPMPPVVKQLLIANVAVFLLTRLPGIDTYSVDRLFGLVPADVFAQGHVWQLVTYMFLHGGVLHILFNMLILWMFGTTVEHNWGSRDFFVYYMVCGVGGALLSWVLGPNSTVPTVGASAAVLGLLLAYTMMYPNRQVLVYFLIPIKMKWLMWILVAIDVLGAMGFQRGNTAHLAHLGGLLFGYIYLKQDWRLGAFGRKMRGMRARHEMHQRVRHAERMQATQQEIDRILEKISREGMDSLTPREVEILRDASRR